VGQRGIALERPESGRNRRRSQEQDDEDVLELRHKAPPGRNGFLRSEFVASEASESCSRLLVGQPLPLVGRERRNNLPNGETVRKTRIRRFAQRGRQLVCSLKWGFPQAR